jgi:uncharacterized protein (DUF4415 family)
VFGADVVSAVRDIGSQATRTAFHSPWQKKPRHISQKDWDAVDSPPLSDAILAAMKPAREAFPDLAEESARRKRGERGPQKKPRKVLISLRVERSTIEAYKAAGWVQFILSKSHWTH